MITTYTELRCVLNIEVEKYRRIVSRNRKIDATQKFSLDGIEFKIINLINDYEKKILSNYLQQKIYFTEFKNLKVRVFKLLNEIRESIDVDGNVRDRSSSGDKSGIERIFQELNNTLLNKFNERD